LDNIIIISTRNYDENHIFISFKKNGENIFFDFGLCNFENEMELWDMPTKLVKFNDERGFIFNKTISKEDLEMEIKRFILHNKLGDVE